MNIDPDEEEDMERFEISDRDIEFAINPSARRGLSKSQHLYGIWGDRDESDDDDEMATHSGVGFASNRKQQKNYSAPISFVSGGVKHGNRIEGTQSDESIERKDDEPIQLERRPNRQRAQRGGNVFAGLRSSTIHSTVDPEKFADWAKYSKSEVIMRMMRNMGYVPGQGLGAQKQGIVEPVQPVLRPGRAAIGAYGKESKGPKFGESAADAQRRADVAVDDEGSEKVAQRWRGNWRKTTARKTLSYQYKTVEEVLAEGGTLGKRLEIASGIKVIDMTGKEQKVYSGYEAYAAKTRAIAETEKERLAFDVPELTYNLNALVDMTEETIRRNNQQLRFLQDQTVALENDRNQLNIALSKERNEQKRMKEVLAILESFSSTVDTDEEPTLEDCRELFQKLQANYYEEYRLFNLEQVAVASVLPLIKKHFSTWDPLDKNQTDYGYSMMVDWKKILEIEDRSVLGTTKSLENLTPFERLLWEGWMPYVRRASLRWNPRDDGQSMLAVIDRWLSLLPLWMRENLLEQVIIPRISTQVDEWNPVTDHIPIHIWMHPWLDIMGDRLQPVFSPIRQKLCKALREWNPTDHSALSMLRPWKGVWAAATMSAFLAQNITPKLEKALRDMDYDPTRNKRYDEFYAVISWIEMLGAENIASIFARSFFPKWYETLCIWLEAPGVVMEQVALWYNEWKARFPMEISSLPLIREQLMRALMAMNEAQQGLRINRQQQSTAPPKMSIPPPPLSMHSSAQMPILPGDPLISLPHRPSAHQVQPLSQHLSFKDIVEMRARHAGVVYAPQGNKFYDGKRVFTFGRMSIYLDRNVIFAFNVEAQQWAPIALDHLLSIC